MPSIQNVVADFHNGSIVGVSQMPDSATTNMDKVVSSTCRVKYNFVHMNASLTGTNRLKCEGAAASPIFNGSYLFFEDNWTTVANMDLNRKIVVSGKFSGCLWKIYRSADAGVFKCCHIARPGGVGSDALVMLSGSYAGQSQWTQVQSMATVGHVGVNGCVEVFVVSQLMARTIDTVVLDINNQGLVVGTTFQSDAI